MFFHFNSLAEASVGSSMYVLYAAISLSANILFMYCLMASCAIRLIAEGTMQMESTQHGCGWNTYTYVWVLTCQLTGVIFSLWFFYALVFPEWGWQTCVCIFWTGACWIVSNNSDMAILTWPSVLKMA